MTGDEDIKELSATLARSYCGTHQDETLKYYCFDCKAPLCVTCFVVLHSTHKCSDINEVADEFRIQVNGDIEHLAGAVTRCRKLIGEAEKNKEEFGQTICEAERAICDRTERLLQHIEQEKQKLLKIVLSCKFERFKQIDHVINEVEQHVSFIESLMEYAGELASKGTAGAVTQQTSSIHDTSTELLKLDRIQEAVSDLGSMQVTFTASTTWPTQSSANIIGQWEAHRTNGDF